MLVTLNWVAVCTNFISTCLLNSLHVFLPPLEFSSTVVVEFWFYDNVPLIRHVIKNHVNCSELRPLWLSADQHFELCQIASHLKEGFWFSFIRITNFPESNSNSIKNRAFRVITYFLFREVRIFSFYIPNKTQIYITNPDLPNVSFWQSESYTLWKLHSVTATQCDSQPVWRL